MRRAIYTSILVALSGCSLTADDYKEIIDHVGRGEVKEEPVVSLPAQPEVLPAPFPSPTPEAREEEPEPEKKPGRVPACPDAGRVIVGHDYTARVGSVSRGCSALVFTGGRGGLEVLESKYDRNGGELKIGLPWDYSCSLAKDVKVCNASRCRSARNDQTEWVNWDSTAQGKMATQWIRFGNGNSLKRLLGSEDPKGVFFKVDGCRVDLCTKQWKKENRCS